MSGKLTLLCQISKWGGYLDQNKNHGKKISNLDRKVIVQ